MQWQFLEDELKAEVKAFDNNLSNFVWLHKFYALNS